MPGRREHDGGVGHSFGLELDGVRVAVLSEVTGLAWEREVIEMRDGKPVWVKGKCVMCLGCLHRCPKFAYHQLTRANTVFRG